MTAAYCAGADDGKIRTQRCRFGCTHRGNLAGAGARANRRLRGRGDYYKFGKLAADGNLYLGPPLPDADTDTDTHANSDAHAYANPDRRRFQRGIDR